MEMEVLGTCAGCGKATGAANGRHFVWLSGSETEGRIGHEVCSDCYDGMAAAQPNQRLSA